MKKVYFTIGIFAFLLALNSCTPESSEEVEKNYQAIEKGTPPPTNGIDKGTPPPPNG